MYEIRIRDKRIYPYDMSIENHFINDDFSDCYDTKSKAIDFIKILNNEGIDAYLWEDWKNEG